MKSSSWTAWEVVDVDVRLMVYIGECDLGPTRESTRTTRAIAIVAFVSLHFASIVVALEDDESVAQGSIQERES